MPALSDLNARLDNNDDQKNKYDLNLPQAKKIAQKMPLIHVTGNNGRPFLEMLISPNSELPTSKTHENESPPSNTILTEDCFSLGRCLYLYAGRACPDFGNLVLAFPPEVEDSQTGSVTPFDTGGLFRGYIHPLAGKPELERTKFATDSLFELSDWRSAFAQFIAAYFNSLPEYWVGKPIFDDPEHILLDPKNQWQAWTFEIHFHKNMSIWSRNAWSSSKDQYEAIRQELLAPGRSDTERASIRRFLEGGHYVMPTNPRIFTEDFEVWIREQTLK